MAPFSEAVQSRKVREDADGTFVYAGVVDAEWTIGVCVLNLRVVRRADLLCLPHPAFLTEVDFPLKLNVLRLTRNFRGRLHPCAHCRRLHPAPGWLRAPGPSTRDRALSQGVARWGIRGARAQAARGERLREPPCGLRARCACASLLLAPRPSTDGTRRAQRASRCT
jgi:hypothetical protein